MSHEPDEAVDVLRAVWAAEGSTADTLDEDCGPTKSCRNMKDVSFAGFAEDGGDIRVAWRATLEREGKLSSAGDSIRDLVLGNTPAR